MSKKAWWLLCAFLALLAACFCFISSHKAGPMGVSLVLFVAGTFLILAFFIALFHYLEKALTDQVHGIFFTVGMLVVSSTFSLLYFFIGDIVGYDIDAYDVIDAALSALIAFVFVAFCSIVFFRRLRVHADSLYTAGFTAACATVSALLYLLSDILPASEVLEAVRLVVVISSLSLALSLFLMERDKRRREKHFKN